jgi:hypothetical protein
MERSSDVSGVERTGDERSALRVDCFLLLETSQSKAHFKVEKRKYLASVHDMRP